jgi:alginate O-acetyltransferase complex protein AlgI
MPLDSGAYFLFLACAVILWRLLRQRYAALVLIAASLIFYAASSFTYMVLIVAVAFGNFLSARLLTTRDDGPARTRLFAAAVIANVASLVFFKLAAIHLPALLFPLSLLPRTPAAAGLLFPLGWSFFTFQMIGCLVDAYRRDFQWRMGALPFLEFGLFFPQISSGPIPRAAGLVPQLLKNNPATSADFAAGVTLMASGLVKKCVVANRLHVYVVSVFGSPSSSGLPVLLAIVFNAIELYADFSGYTDLARGSARLFGIHLMENFDRPFLAESVTDFWRRWHISFSTWLRDYLYLPLSIRLRSLGAFMPPVAFLITFVLCGLWHNVTWNMVVFGVLHGRALCVEQASRKLRKRLMRSRAAVPLAAAGRVYAITFFVATLVLFQTASLRQTWDLFVRASHLTLPVPAELFREDGPVVFALIFVALGCWHVVNQLRDRLEEAWTPCW